MGRGGTYRVIGIVGGIVHAASIGLGHTLYLERENAQLIHNGRYTSGNHTEVFATDEHIGTVYQGRKFLHRLAIPEVIVAMIVEVVMQSIEGLTLVLGERLERLGLETIDAGMIATGLVGVLNEEHIGLISKGEGHGMAFLVEAYACGIDLLHGKWHGGIEMSEESALGVSRYLPYAEEAQQMVDTVGIEIVGHLGEALSKPVVTLGCHSTPIVSGEAPVLPVSSKSIGRSTGLTLQAEESGMAPCLHTGAADADGDISLEYHAMAMGIVGSMLELLMQVVLDIEVDGAYSLVVIGIVDAVVAPLGIVGRTILISQVAERCIGT